MKNKKILKLDIDGVLRNMEDPMLDTYNKDFGENMTAEDIFDYDVDVAFPKIKESGKRGFEYFFVENADSTVINADAYNGIVEAIERLSNDYVIMIVSYQPSYNAKVKTLEWLEQHNVKYDSIVFTSTPNKSYIPCDIIVDDCPKYLNEESDDVIRCCIDHAYNRDWEYTYRCKSLLEFANKIID